MSIDGEGDPFAGFVDGDGNAASAAPAVTTTQDEADTEGLHEADEKPELELKPEDEVQEGESEEEQKQRRSKPLRQRLGEVSEKKNLAEQERDYWKAVAEGRIKPDGAEPAKLPDKPDPASFEFGEGDPDYHVALIDWKVETRLAQERAKEAEGKQKADFRAVTEQADTDWQAKVAKGTEKYQDFAETVVESAAAAEWPLLPLSAAAVAQSEVGEDIAYHLATNHGDAEKLAGMERQFHQTIKAAKEAGIPDSVAQMFAQPIIERATEFFEGLEAKFKNGTQQRADLERRVTKAPEPPKHSVRGGAGKFEVDATTTDFAAFERKVNGR